MWYFNVAGGLHTHPPMVDQAQRIQERLRDRSAGYYHRNDSAVIPGYVDAIVGGVQRYNNCVNFFKGDEVFCLDHYQTMRRAKIADEWSGVTSPVNASFHIKGLTYIISGSKLWCFLGNKQPAANSPVDISKLHPKFPTEIEAAFLVNGIIYLLRGHQYFTINATRFPVRTNLVLN